MIVILLLFPSDTGIDHYGGYASIAQQQQEQLQQQQQHMTLMQRLSVERRLRMMEYRRQMNRQYGKLTVASLASPTALIDSISF